MKNFPYVKSLIMGIALNFPLAHGFAEVSQQAVQTPRPTHTIRTAVSSGTEEGTSAQEKKDEEQIGAWMIESAQVAKAYVEGLDKGRYAESWSQGDPLFQKTITSKEWVTALESTRKPLGKLKTRKLKDQRTGWDPQGLPKGAYMVVEYQTAFEHAPQANELLTLRRDPDGKWRVLTYEVSKFSE